MKANHNYFTYVYKNLYAVVNILKEQFESKSQHRTLNEYEKLAVVNILKEQFESKSQLRLNAWRLVYCCGKYLKRTI